MGIRFKSFLLGMLLCLVGILFISQSLQAWSKSAASQKRPALYEFGEKICIHCRQMQKVMTELTTSHGSQVEFRLVWVDEEKDLFRQYRITVVPTQVFLDASGKEVDRHVGALTKEEVLKKLKALNLIK
jgi:thioredoxin 1